MTRFWWVRHGPTHARVMLGWTDLPADLSDRAALSRLEQYLPARAVVVSSDLTRAVDTAAALAGGRPRLPADVRLREMNFGDWDGRAFDALDAEKPGQLRDFFDDPGSRRAPGGESWDDTVARVDEAVSDLARQGHDDLIVVAHMGPILSRVQQALGLSAYDAFARQVDPLSVTRIDLHEAGARAVTINHCP